MARIYLPQPNYRKNPKLFIERENWPFEGDTLLKNNLWLRKERFGSKEWPYTINKSGASPSGGAATVGHARTKVAAILLAMDLVQLEPPEQKRARVEAQARAGMDPIMVSCLEELFEGCRHALGLPLGEDVRGRLRAYFEDPNVETWDDIYSIVISPKGTANTVWQFWCQLNPDAPRLGPVHNADGHRDEWDLIPSPVELLCVLRDAAHRNEQASNQKR